MFIHGGSIVPMILAVISGLSKLEWSSKPKTCLGLFCWYIFLLNPLVARVGCGVGCSSSAPIAAAADKDTMPDNDELRMSPRRHDAQKWCIKDESPPKVYYIHYVFVDILINYLRNEFINYLVNQCLMKSLIDICMIEQNNDTIVDSYTSMRTLS